MIKFEYLRNVVPVLNGTLIKISAKSKTNVRQRIEFNKLFMIYSNVGIM
jgi:hypothetical protein